MLYFLFIQPFSLIQHNLFENVGRLWKISGKARFHIFYETPLATDVLGLLATPITNISYKNFFISFYKTYKKVLYRTSLCDTQSDVTSPHIMHN